MVDRRRSRATRAQRTSLLSDTGRVGPLGPVDTLILDRHQVGSAVGFPAASSPCFIRDDRIPRRVTPIAALDERTGGIASPGRFDPLNPADQRSRFGRGGIPTHHLSGHLERRMRLGAVGVDWRNCNQRQQDESRCAAVGRGSHSSYPLVSSPPLLLLIEPSADIGRPQPWGEP